MALKLRVSFQRQRLEFYYSIFLIVLIPVLLAANTLWLSASVRKTYDEELRHKANLANEIFGVTAAGQLNDKAKLQAQVEGMAKADSEVREARVILPQGTSFVIAASSNKDEVGKAADDIQTSLVWQQKQPIATLLNSESGGQLWRVLTPINNAAGQPVAIAVMSVSVAQAQAAINANVTQSLILLIITVIVILLLLANHFRFVSYAVLFQKQKELDQMKDDFISVATHELKAPMTTIKGYISLVLEGDTGEINADVRKTLEVAMQQSERLGHLVADLLDVSRIEQGRTKFELAAVDLSEIIKQIVETSQLRAKEKALKLTYEVSTDLPKLQLDPDRAREIFTNLIDNAIKYTAKGSVTVKHEIDANHVRTIVKDTGFGISAEAREKLFQRFYRVRTDKTKDIAGTGLGLWIIKQYIEKMGGHIYVDSMEGVGSSFTVEFPRK